MVELIVGLVIGAAVSLVTVTAVTSSKMCGLHEKIQELQEERDYAIKMANYYLSRRGGTWKGDKRG